MKKLLLTLAITSLVASSVFASDIPVPEKLEDMLSKDYTGVSYSPYAGKTFPEQAYWGDTHLHTANSFDAGAFGARLLPEDAYRFARGEEVVSSKGIKAKLSRPLDFLVVADHSDNMGFFTDLVAGKPHLLSNPQAKDWYDRIQEGKGVGVAMEIINLFGRGKFPKDLVYWPDSQPYKDVWKMTVDAAEKYNDPHNFTAFVGYEWTSLVMANNMHRVVIYRDGADKALQMVPYITMPPAGSQNPRDLWKWMQEYETKTGGRVLAIPHNGNLSNGIMFPVDAQYDGKKLDKEYVELRHHWEPLYEAVQIKGDGETHPFLSPNDEFADYETWDIGNLNGTPDLKTDDMLQYEYAREALKNGLLLEKRFGTNPYKFGMIGSTDSHTGLATAEEDNFFGKHSGYEPHPHRMGHAFASNEKASIMGWQQVAGGLAAVWAKDNTREALFEAMERKETYGTTGSRMSVRFFGGWEYTENDLNSRLPAFAGYKKGVPMGGDLTNAPEEKAPTFMVYAVKDPISGNLDRIQIVKGWLDESDKTHERIYDVAVSDGRKIDKNGRCKTPVGNTVDAKTANFTNTIGSSELGAVWTDPDFNPKDKAVYYARVIEIPTPRWSTIEAFRFGIDIPEGAPVSTQERAYTSPIWYTP